MKSVYDSYLPDKYDLANKKEVPRFRPKPIKKDEGDIPYSKYMDSRPLKIRPFERLLANWR